MKNKRHNLKYRGFGYLAMILAVLGIATPLILGSQNNKALEVEAAAVTKRDMEVSIVGSGTMKPTNVRIISSEVAAIIDKMDLKTGDQIFHGQILAQLSSPELQSAVNQARGELEIAQKTLDATQKAYLRQRLNNAASQAQAGSITLDEAQSVFSAYKRMLNDSVFVWQDQTASELPTDPEDIRAKMEVEQKQVDLAQEKLGDLESRLDTLVLQAPFDGIVLECYASVGAAVNVGSPIMMIADASSLEICVTMNELDYARVKPGMQVQLSTIDNYTSAGSVSRKGNIISETMTSTSLQRMGEVWIAADRNTGLGPGASVTAKILLDPLKQVDSIPVQAVEHEDGKPFVYVIEDGVAKRQSIKISTSNSRYAQVTGLKSGAQVVCPIPEGIKDGQKVSVKDD
ncbi:MAG: efflux RND transporter periplasmic adaptor subunit [Christensenellales bacterium]|jgi:HlyD family secretion protein